MVKVNVNTAPKPDSLDAHDFAPTVTLLNVDRCDLCGAQAYVSAQLAGYDNPLLFCGHHYSRFSAHPHLNHAAIVDERWRLADQEQRRRAEGVSPD